MKVIMGIAGAYLFLLWALCIGVFIDRSGAGVYGWWLTPLVIVATVFTVLAAQLLTRAWRREEGFVAAVLTSLVAAAAVFVLLLALILAGSLS